MATVPPTTTSPTSTTPSASTPAAGSSPTPATDNFATHLDAEMKHIAARATSVETLKNGAKLYHLPNGRIIEEVPGKTPYVVKAGTGYGVKKPAATTPAAPTTPTTPPASTTPSSGTTTTPSTPTSGTTTPTTTTPTTATTH